MKKNTTDKKNNKNKKQLLKLFFTMLYISTFTFGGGFVIVTFMKKKFVDEYSWIDEDEMLDLTAIAQSSPGAIAVNAAILVGTRVGGFAGMITAVVATIIPPLVIISVISLIYSAFASNVYVATVLKGMQAGVAAVILDVVCDLGLKVIKKKSVLHCLIAVASFVAVFFFNVNVIYIIIAAGILGVLSAIFSKFVSKKRENTNLCSNSDLNGNNVENVENSENFKSSENSGNCKKVTEGRRKNDLP